ncbi:lipase family protein [Sorangium sp. So ce1000]|uniref:lipase family protein n=1 Tax=Sorangium sp. So ce1000 TaxID=3133325 RepID=UPI003F63D7B9
MIIETICAPNYRIPLPPTTEETAPADRFEILKGVPPEVYDRDIVESLATMSAWSYSDIRTFAERMARRGFGGSEIAYLSIRNDALFLDTTAVLVQSGDGETVCLCFRGTEPKNVITWLTDASARAAPFYSRGHVHGGFYRAVRALRYALHRLLTAAVRGHSICEMAAHLDRVMGPERMPGGAPVPEAPPMPAMADVGPKKKMDAFYVTGHSLGGALAVVAASMISDDDEFAKSRARLRGVYTYGQPMVGDSMFVEAHESLGKKVHRHVYGRDIVPRMPPRTMGPFRHLGQQYSSTSEGWMRIQRPAAQAYVLLLSNIVGVAAWLTQEVFSFGLPFLSYSWGDHSPLNYLRTSSIIPPGTEMD